MRWLLSLPGILAASAFIVASGAMNWIFMEAQGHSLRESRILGAVSLAITVFNAILPFGIRRALDQRHLVSAAVGGLALALFLCFSLLSAVGFAAMNRGAVSNDRETLNTGLALAEGELRELEAERAARPGPVRPAVEIEQELAALRVNARWTSTRECTAPTVPESRAFCESYFKLKGGLGAALSSARKDQRRAQLREELRGLRAKGAGQEIDPQASMLTGFVRRWVPAVDFSDVRMLLTLFVAVLVEFGATFGLFLALGPERVRGRAWRARKRKARAAPRMQASVVRRSGESGVALVVARAENAERAWREPERFGAEHARSLLSSVTGRT